MISIDLSLDGQNNKIKLPEQQYTQVYQPLAEWAVQLQEHLQHRILIGIGGPPGCGKTFFSHLLSAIINQQYHGGTSVVVGMDGWHFSSQLLEEKNNTFNGEQYTLKQMKGVPESFDVHAFLMFLTQLPVENSMNYPIYDRNLHEPVAEKGHIINENKIILIEGNYLLLAEDPWINIRKILDASIFISAGHLLRWQTLMRRHLRGGKETVQAIHHVKNVDMANARRIGAPAADIQLRRISENELILESGLKSVNR